MLKHILKRIGLFCFWLLIILCVLYFKNKYFELSELIVDVIFPTLILILLSGIFLIFESAELKKNGDFTLYKTNIIFGILIFTFISILIILLTQAAILFD